MNRPMPPLLETPRLTLRQMSEADAGHVYLLNGSPQVTRYLGEPTLDSPEQALAILRTHIFPQYEKYGVGRWAVVLKAGAEFIGWCGLKYLADPDEYDLGYRFRESFWGQGYATEAARAVLQFGREQLPGKRIVGKVLVENLASRRVLEKLGLRFTAYEKDDSGTTAVYVDAADASPAAPTPDRKA